MLLIIGGYRGPWMTLRALESLSEFATGIDRVVVVDDSGRLDWAEQIRWMTLKTENGPIHPHVVETGKQGYNVAMRRVLRLAPDTEPFLFWEEDFILTEPTDFRELAGILEREPSFAQIALLRGPHFPIEHETGGVIPGLLKRLGPARVDLQMHVAETAHSEWRNATGELTLTETHSNRVDYISQLGTFTCNPSVWAPIVKKVGWPRGQWSEDKMRDALIQRGYRFAFLDRVRVTHDGERSGFGY
jgi:hypothetical protein